MDDKELVELVTKEEGSTSPEPNEIRKEVKILLEIIFWGKVHDKLENQKMNPISKLDEIIFELNKNLKAMMVKIAPKSLREHASFLDYVLKQLLCDSCPSGGINQ